DVEAGRQVPARSLRPRDRRRRHFDPRWGRGALERPWLLRDLSRRGRANAHALSVDISPLYAPKGAVEFDRAFRHLEPKRARYERRRRNVRHARRATESPRVRTKRGRVR